MLEILDKSLEEMLKTQTPNLKASDRINLFRETRGSGSFTRKDYLVFFKNISTATARRDLRKAVESGLLKKLGDKRTTKYTFVQAAP